jgi:hypothetical protein
LLQRVEVVNCLGREIDDEGYPMVPSNIHHHKLFLKRRSFLLGSGPFYSSPNYSLLQKVTGHLHTPPDTLNFSHPCGQMKHLLLI